MKSMYWLLRSMFEMYNDPKSGVLFVAIKYRLKQNDTKQILQKLVSSTNREEKSAK